jgi:hypothetical protein
MDIIINYYMYLVMDFIVLFTSLSAAEIAQSV